MELADLQRLAAHVEAHEEWLMARILHYAKERGYSKYTSTLVEPWRLSIQGLTNALVGAVSVGRLDMELHPDEDLAGDVVAAFAILEAQRHRKRGVSLAMFLGLMKYYRQSYLDLLEICPLPALSDKVAEMRLFLHRFFDRLEIAFCVEWTELAGEKTVEELQQENRRMTNEKNLYLTALESHPDAIIVTDEQQRIREMNPAALALLASQQVTGYSYYQQGVGKPDELVVRGMDLAELAPWLSSSLQLVLANHQELSFCQLLDDGGQQRYIQLILTPMLDISDKFQGLLVSLVDISPTVTSYQALQVEEQARYQMESRLLATLQAVEQVGLLEIANDAKQSITYCSPGLQRLTSLPAAESQGRSLACLLSTEKDLQLLSHLQRQAVTSGQPASGEVALLCQDGTALPVLMSVQALHHRDNKSLSGFLAVLVDLRERKRLELQLLQSEKMTTIASLAAGVAHEINTPLSGILQAVQLIEQDVLADTEDNERLARENGVELAPLKAYLAGKDLDVWLGGIREAASSAASIVANLLQFSRPNDDQKVAMNLNDLLERSLVLVSSDYQLKKQSPLAEVTVVRQFQPDLPGCPCVAQELEQVFVNLLKNALQALAGRESDRELRLATSVQGGQLTVTISDNGVGMDQNTKMHAFDPFFTTKGVGEGTGLGLTVCHTIIRDQHQGSITIDSAPQQGTTLTITLPCHVEGDRHEQ